MTDHGPDVERVYPPKLMFAVVNPIMKAIMSTPLGAKLDGLARLDFDGRRTGNRYRIVTAVHEIDGERAVLTNSGWRHNFEGGHPVEVVRGSERSQAVGVLEADPEAVARVYHERIEELGTDQSARRLGIAIHGDGVPSEETLTDLARAEGLSVIWLRE